MTTTRPYSPLGRIERESPEQLRARIPGWGADLDPADRPAVPREVDQGVQTGHPVPLPDRQPERWPRERSIEHAALTPVFGTSCPPRGLSGAMRKFAYARYSEARAAHWLLLLAADRVDSKEQALRSLLTRRPDDPITETGVLSEIGPRRFTSRFGRDRVDVVHHPIDTFIVALPWAVSGWLTYRLIRRVPAGRLSRRDVGR